MQTVTLLKAFSYKVASNDTSIYKAKSLAKYTWFNFGPSFKKSLVELFVEDFVNDLVRLNGASLSYEFNGKVILSATLKYITSMQIEVKTPSFTITVPDDIDDMKTKMLEIMSNDPRTVRQTDLSEYIESLR